MVCVLFPLQASAHEPGENPGEGKPVEIQSGGHLYRLAVINPAADFVLINPEGKKINLKDRPGRIKISNFIYTYCPDACPIVTGRLADLQGVLKKQGWLGGKVEILSIPPDPERDTPQELKKYAEGFQADPHGWFFLRGTEEQTRKVLSDHDIWTQRLEEGTSDHVMRVYLIDGKDRIREIYNLAFLQPELVVRDIEMILREE